jgi:uncharacterized protein (TIGR02270 family)
MRVAETILWQHAQLAAFLWAQREALVAADPPETLAVKGIDGRLVANLDGLRIAGAAAWPIVVEQYESYPDKGEQFVAAILAFEQGEARRIEQVVGFARSAADEAGLIGALGWLPTTTIAPLVKRWLGSADGFERLLAAAALRLHGVDPKRRLEELMADPDHRVRGEAFRIAGALMRQDLLGPVLRGLEDPEPTARFWAGWAGLALGQVSEALPTVKAQVRPGATEALTALRCVLKALPKQDGRRWLGELEVSYVTRKLAVRGLGMTGDPKILPWLVEAMADPNVAPSAAQAFVEIHGTLDEPDDYFFANNETASTAYGIDLSEEEGRFPISDKFAKLIPLRTE